MSREPEPREVKVARMRLMSLINHYGLADPKTAAAAAELARIRADVAEATARELREAASAMAAGVPVTS